VCFWNKQPGQYLTSTTLLAGSKGAAVGIDAYEDYFAFARITLGSVLAANEAADTAKQNADRFLAGGGNAVLRVTVPVLSGSSGPRAVCSTGGAGARTVTAPGGGVNRTGIISFHTFVSPRLGVDIPALGTPSDNAQWNVDLGGSERVSVQAARGILSFFGELRGAWVIGSKGFRQGLRFPRESFGYLQLTLGALIQSKVFIAYSVPVATPESIREHFKGAISLSLQP
jgi:hypothetical protein